MPSKSKSQQRFMGMVHAAQKGDIKHPSAKIKRAAASMSDKDAKDFASTSHEGLPEKIKESTMSNINPATPALTPVSQPQVTMEQVLQSIAEYNKFGTILRRATSMSEVGQKLAQIAEYAEMAVVNEADDWFDRHTVSRNMKEIKSYSKEFQKLAQEADLIEQRMTAFYDDMGRILERYFEIPNGEEHVATGLPQTTEQPQKIEEKGALEPDTLELTPMRPVKEEPDNTTPISNIDRNKKMDELTLRAIIAVWKRLKQKNPQVAVKFANLPPEKMEELVWKLVC